MDTALSELIDALKTKLELLSNEQLADIVAHVDGLLPSDSETYPAPPNGWTCFHCGAHFWTVRGARLHFGPTPKSVPHCFT